MERYWKFSELKEMGALEGPFSWSQFKLSGQHVHKLPISVISLMNTRGIVP